MTLNCCFTCLILLCSLTPYSQPWLVKGIVLNENNQPVPGASVIVSRQDSGKIVNYKITGSDGRFLVDLESFQAGKYKLEIKHISYEFIQREFNLPLEKAELDFPRFVLQPKNVELKEIVIKREAPVIIRSDTIQFNTSSYMNSETIKLEGLIRNIAGFSVDGNGKISFNGKPVEKVLIEGDDLADKGYRLITKNLNASIIDKIQVINNYNDNRLVGGVSESNKVGINIKIVPGKKDQISGSISAGISPEKRYKAEGSMVYIGKPFKILSFLNANNTADNPEGNVSYYYEQEGSGEYALVDELKEGILSAGAVYLPAIGERYVNNNKDVSATVMSSWKTGRHTKMKAMTGVSKLAAYRLAQAENSTWISDMENWTTINKTGEQLAGKDIIVNLSMQRDPMRNHISHVDIGLGCRNKDNNFENISSGSITDTLKDRLKESNRFVHFNWSESLRLKGKTVFNSFFKFQAAQINQGFYNKSGRFTSLYHLDSAYTLAYQALSGIHCKGEYNASIYLNKGKKQSQLGIRCIYLKSDFNSASSFMKEQDPYDVLDTGIQMLKTRLNQVAMYFNSMLRNGKTGSVNIQVETGYSFLQIGRQEAAYPLIKASLQYTHAVSVLKTFRFKYEFLYDFVDFRRLYPSMLISGDGSVLNGAVYIEPSVSQRWIAGYHSTNVFRNSQWSASISLSKMMAAYNNAVVTNPYFTMSTYLPFQPNMAVFASLTGDKFISLIKSKIGSTFSLGRSATTHSVNSDTGVSFRNSYTLEGRWSTGFSLPVNFETKASIVFFKGRWQQEPSNLGRQYFCSGKLKWLVGSKTYAAIICNYYVLAPASKFTGLDAYVQYRISPKWKLSFQCSNLLNERTVSDKRVMAFSSSQSAFRTVGRYLLFTAELQL